MKNSLMITLLILCVVTIIGIHTSIPTIAASSESFTPKKQMASGILPEDVICKEGLELVFKSTDNSPACVKIKSLVKLYERSWLSKEPSHLDYLLLAEEAARQFVISSPTFSYDGIEGTLKVGVTIIRDSLPPYVTLIATFSSLHDGYGDRSDEVLAQVITEHKMMIGVHGTQVRSAVIDDVWDELKQSWWNRPE